MIVYRKFQLWINVASMWPFTSGLLGKLKRDSYDEGEWVNFAGLFLFGVVPVVVWEVE